LRLLLRVLGFLEALLRSLVEGALAVKLRSAGFA
jgi:hypothetical protein